MIKVTPNKISLRLKIYIPLILLLIVTIFTLDNRYNAPERYALLVGGGVTEYDNYESFYNNIEYAASVLKQLDYQDENIKILFLGGNSSNRPLAEDDATKRNLIDNLKYYAKRIDSNDSLLIFRSGHGIIELVNEKYGKVTSDKEVPKNRNMKNTRTAAVMRFPDGSLSYIELQESLGKIKAGQIIVILNQCFSGQFTEIATKLEKTVIVSETEEVGFAFYSKRKSKRWNHKVWPYVKCMFDGFLINEPEGPTQSVFSAFEYMLSCNPNVMGLSVRADRPLLKETPQIKYGKGLKKGGVYISDRRNYK